MIGSEFNQQHIFFGGGDISRCLACSKYQVGNLYIYTVGLFIISKCRYVYFCVKQKYIYIYIYKYIFI